MCSSDLALALMNDEPYIESARRLAERAMAVDAADVSGKIGLAFRLATCRVPTADESAVLLDTYQTHLATYQQNAAAAEALVNIGETKRNAALDVPQLAAMTLVCNLILNLDETVTKE